MNRFSLRASGPISRRNDLGARRQSAETSPLRRPFPLRDAFSLPRRRGRAHRERIHAWCTPPAPAGSNEHRIECCSAHHRGGRESPRTCTAYINRGAAYAMICELQRAIDDGGGLKLRPGEAIVVTSRCIPARSSATFIPPLPLQRIAAAPALDRRVEPASSSC